MRKMVLWGHYPHEYKEMFDLSEDDLHKKILEYGCGPTAVNAACHQAMMDVVSCDPLFTLDKAAFSEKASLIFDQMVERVKKNQASFDFSQYGGLDGLIAKRLKGMNAFFEDYETGLTEKRYVPLHDYTLPFASFSFDFALCSHYLFADLDDQDVDFHLQVIRELARVAKEVRIFPLIDRKGQPSPFLGPVLLGLQKANYGTEIREVSYHLQPMGNAMLRVWAQQCEVN